MYVGSISYLCAFCGVSVVPEIQAHRRLHRASHAPASIAGFLVISLSALALVLSGPIYFPGSHVPDKGVSGDPLRDAEALLSFIKMEDGLLRPDQVQDAT